MQKIIIAAFIVVFGAISIAPLQYFSHYITDRKFLTNPRNEDGFGAQFQYIIYAAIYAELHNLTFVYTPFSNMEHNYDHEPDFLSKKENLINLIGSFQSSSQHPFVRSKKRELLTDFVESNLESSSKTLALQNIKQAFLANKPADFFNNNKFNIAVHIRRPNQQDIRIAGADTPDAVYLKIISDLKERYATKDYLFHIYSQGNPQDFKAYLDAKTVLHLNESVEDTFCGFVYADALVTSASSFSYAAAMLSNGEIYYLPFWHPPLPEWHVLDVPSRSMD